MRVDPRAFAAESSLAAVALLFSLPCAAADDSSEIEAKMIAVTTWDGDCTTYGTRDSWDDMVDAWYQELTDGGPFAFWRWSQAGQQVDGDIVDSEFIDCADETWGEDCAAVDAADAVMVGLHGGNDSADHRWIGIVRENEPGQGDCEAWQAEMRFGDEDLEFLHLSSCVSMDYEDWYGEWDTSFDGLHQVDGFHGAMWIGTSLVTDYSDFAADASWFGMADAFLDNMYIPDISSTHDQCPVARAVGESSALTSLRLSLEGYFFRGTDPPGIASFQVHSARSISGCDPYGEDPLP